MTRPRISVVTHLKEVKPPAMYKLRIILTEMIKAVYGEDVVLDLQRGSTGDNPYENMVQIHSALNTGTRHHMEGILDRKFGPHFIVGYNREFPTEPNVKSHFTEELDAAEARIDERLNK
jgi:hypothetical protein